MIDNNNAMCIKKVLRVKNGFKSIKEWKSAEHANYVDIKFNVVIEYNNQCIIGELQFLLKFLLKAKKIGHKLYGIIRRREFIDSTYEMIKCDSNYNEYKSKIYTMIANSDSGQLIRHLVLSPNTILSMIKDKVLAHIVPMLFYCNYHATLQECKLFDLFWSCMYHFQNNLLFDEIDSNLNSSSNGKSKPFFEKYLEYNECKETHTKNLFYGVRLYSYQGTPPVNEDSIGYRICDKIMKSDYFKGIKLNKDTIGLLWTAVMDSNDNKSGWYQFINLLLKYENKNEEWINCDKVYNYQADHVMDYTPLMQLSKNKEFDEKWFDLLFDFSYNLDLTMKNKNGQTVLDMFQAREKEDSKFNYACTKIKARLDKQGIYHA